MEVSAARRRAVLRDPRFTGHVIFLASLWATLWLGGKDFALPTSIAGAVISIGASTAMVFVIDTYTFPRRPVSEREAVGVRTLLIGFSVLWVVGYFAFQWIRS